MAACYNNRCDYKLNGRARLGAPGLLARRSVGWTSSHTWRVKQVTHTLTQAECRSSQHFAFTWTTLFYKDLPLLENVNPKPFVLTAIILTFANSTDDGKHPSLTCATSAGKIFIHSPHAQDAQNDWEMWYSTCSSIVSFNWFPFFPVGISILIEG